MADGHGTGSPRDVLVADLVAPRPRVPADRSTMPSSAGCAAGVASAPPNHRTAPAPGGCRQQSPRSSPWSSVRCPAPPVRAAVGDLFGFGGVLVREEPGPAPSTAPPPPGATSDLSLAEAADLVPFRPAVPTALGDPDGVEVSADRRVLSLTWATDDGPVRLDQIGARLDYTFAKSATGVRFVDVAGDFALWFRGRTRSSCSSRTAPRDARPPGSPATP